MKIAIGSDHGGFLLKEEIKREILRIGSAELIDIGTDSEDSVDYPDIAEKVCDIINSGGADRGILICGTGIGISIAANKIQGIRAALCGDVYSAKMSRRHNDANVIALGGRVTGAGLACEIIRAWLEEEFEGGRHARRVEKVMALEKK